LDRGSLLEMKVASLDKDSLDALKQTPITLQDGRYVALREIVEIERVRGFEQLIKDSGEVNFYLYANVDPKIVTSTEVLERLDGDIQAIQAQGIRTIFQGEAEKKKELGNDMRIATLLALVLIMLSMLYLFNSFRETLIVMSVIPFSLLGVVLGHKIMGIHLSMPSMIGALGLAGVVINDGIIMMTYLKKAKVQEDILERATKRFRPIILTTITTLIGMSSLIFFPTGQAVIFQPIGIALGFGLAWGTVLNLLYMPTLYILTHRFSKKG
jgi:HAE1 family hydrophobic/amphiphilic exporter-1